MKETNILKLSNITKSFPSLSGGEDLLILDKINLEIKMGETISIQGKSGSGKSTLLSLAALLENPTSGNIYYKDREVSSLNDREKVDLRRNSMAFIFQNSLLLEDFSALENVSFPLLVKGMNKKEAQKEAKEYLERVGLAERLHHRPKELSGGEKQRVAIARALITKPDIIFADEPTGALDEESSSIVENLLLEIANQGNHSLLLVTHNTAFASLCKRQYTLTQKGLVCDK